MHVNERGGKGWTGAGGIPVAVSEHGEAARFRAP